MVTTEELEVVSWEIGIDTYPLLYIKWASLVAQLVKNPPAMGDLHLTPGLGRYPAEGDGYPLQNSGLEFHGLYSPWGCKALGMTE